jgi:acetyl esterase/lipase
LFGAPKGFAAKQRAAGADVILSEYEGAHHAFDNPDFRTPVVAKYARGRASLTSRCVLTEATDKARREVE